MSLSHNKICNLEDFSDPELYDIIREVFAHEIGHFTQSFPYGAEYRKHWEVAMSVRAFRDFGVMHPGSRVLGVGAGTEVTTFYLANHVQQVFATDLYLDPGLWDQYANPIMLRAPETIAPCAFDVTRLVVQHMDGRDLRFPDGFFEGIYSSGSIEHFGGLDSVANAAYEMGRVLKSGGILAISTEFRISGPLYGTGLDGTVLFTSALLEKYIIDASGLEPVDTIEYQITPATLRSEQPLSLFLRDLERVANMQDQQEGAKTVVWSKYPHLVLSHEGYVYCSIHLTLRKTPEGRRSQRNSWAKPIERGRRDHC